MFKIIVSMSAVCLLLPISAHAQQRPLVTEDPETIGAGRVLVEGGFELDDDQLNEAYGVMGDISHIGTFGASVGISPNAELQFDGALIQRLDISDRILRAPLFATLPLARGQQSSGFADLVLATKIRFASETNSRPAFGVRLGAKLPTADEHKGIGLGTTDFFVAALIAKTVQSVRTVGNIGLFIMGNPEDAQDSATALSFGISIARALTNEFEVVGELNGRLTPFGEFVPAGLESRGVFRLAGRYTYSLLRVDFGVVAGITSRDPSFGISAGATYMITR